MTDMSCQIKISPVKPEISVIIPVYNTEQYLSRCIDSVLAQSFKTFELILVDDGSTDSSPDIIREYAKKDGRIRVLTQKHANAGAARNFGITCAEGNYISFLDSDDFFEPDMLEKAYKRITEEESEIAVFGSDYYDNRTGRLRQNDSSIDFRNLPALLPCSGEDIKDLFCSFIGWTWDKLFSRKLLEENDLRFPEQHNSEDLPFVYSSLAKAEKISVMHDILAHHRIHNKESLEASRDKNWECCIASLEILKDHLCQWNLYDRFKQDFINFCIHFSLWYVLKLKRYARKDFLHMMRGERFRTLLGPLPNKLLYYYRPYEMMAFVVLTFYRSTKKKELKRKGTIH